MPLLVLLLARGFELPKAIAFPCHLQPSAVENSLGNRHRLSFLLWRVLGLAENKVSHAEYLCRDVVRACCLSISRLKNFRYRLFCQAFPLSQRYACCVLG